MKKKLISAVLAAMMLLSSVAALAAETNRAILLCYDNDGKLVYSTLMKIGEYISIPEEYESLAKKVYHVDRAEFMTIEEYDVVSGATATAASEATEAPAATDTPATAAPAKTPKPSTQSSSKTDLSGTPFDREVDGMYSPAIVLDVESTVNTDGDEVYAVKVYFHGEEVTVLVDEDLTVSTTPEAYSYMTGKRMDSLEKGDVVCFTANIAGDTIKAVDFITRPAAEDIVTGSTDYGADFEKLFASGGSVAGKWSVLEYGSKPSSSDKYSYAYGIVAKMSGSTLTLLSKDGVTKDALEIDVDANAYVYTCAVDGKEYEIEAGGRNDITTSLPSRLLDDDIAKLTDDYSYNYALVRMVKGTATDVVLYTNYND